MRYLLAALSVVASSGIALADAPAGQPSAVSATIDRGLAFLVKDALAWKNEHNCASCHHAGLVIWSMREAKAARPCRRRAGPGGIDEMGRRVGRRQDRCAQARRTFPRRLNEKAVSFALALGADPEPDAVSQEGMKLLLTTVKSDQIENGSWASWPETRPPIFGNSDERTTAPPPWLLLPAAAAGDDVGEGRPRQGRAVARRNEDRRRPAVDRVASGALAATGPSGGGMGATGPAHPSAAKRRRRLEPDDGHAERRLGDRPGALCVGPRGPQVRRSCRRAARTPS